MVAKELEIIRFLREAITGCTVQRVFHTKAAETRYSFLPDTFFFLTGSLESSSSEICT